VIRAFVAIALPERASAALETAQDRLPPDIPRPAADNLHLTLAFLGELREPDLAEVDLALRQLRAAPFTLRLSGVGVFGGARPRVVWAGFAPCPALNRLQAAVMRAARGAGLDLAARRFVPHVTLARLPGTAPAGAALERWIAGHAGLDGPEFTVKSFGLWQSHLTRAGAVHEELAHYPLAA